MSEEVKAITIKLRDQSGEETFFKVKPTTKMEKVFATYAKRKALQVDNLRFLLDGERIKPEHTVKQVELENEDQIGSFFDCSRSGLSPP